MSNELKQLISDTQSAFRADPAKALATFNTSSRLTQGFRSEISPRWEEPIRVPTRSNSSLPRWGPARKSPIAPMRAPWASR